MNQSGGMNHLDFAKHLLNVEENGLELKNVNVELMTTEQYYKICEAAVEKNGLALQFVQTNKITDKQYYDITFLALNNILPNADKITPEELCKIYLLAVKNNKIFLYYAHQIKDIITSEQYFQICKVAVEKDISALDYVDYVKLGNHNDDFENIVENIRKPKVLRTYLKSDKSKSANDE